MSDYLYTASVESVHDGDTVTLLVDLGFEVYMRHKFRLYGPDPDGKIGMNAPELNTPEGVAARDFLRDVFAKSGPRVFVHSVKDRQEKFGRYLGVLYLMNDDGTRGLNVNQYLLDKGQARTQMYATEDDLG